MNKLCNQTLSPLGLIWHCILVGWWRWAYHDQMILDPTGPKINRIVLRQAELSLSRWGREGLVAQASVGERRIAAQAGS